MKRTSAHHNQSTYSRLIDPDDCDPPEKIASTRQVPTIESLDFAQLIAKRLNLSFVRDHVESQGRNLMLLYFNDILRAVPEIGQNIEIEHGSNNSLDAFIRPSATHNRIFIDDHLDFWLFGLNFLNTLRSCYHFSTEETQHLAKWIQLHLTMPDNPILLHRTIREETCPLMEKFSTILPAANAMTVSMQVFIICHELSHHLLGHLGLAAERQLEFDADTHALTIFRRVAAKRNLLDFAQIDVSTICAPSLMMIYFRELALFRKGCDIATPRHPPLQGRLNRLFALSAPDWPSTAQAKFATLGRHFIDLARTTYP